VSVSRVISFNFRRFKAMVALLGAEENGLTGQTTAGVFRARGLIRWHPRRMVLP